MRIVNEIRLLLLRDYCSSAPNHAVLTTAALQNILRVNISGYCENLFRAAIEGSETAAIQSSETNDFGVCRNSFLSFFNLNKDDIIVSMSIGREKIAFRVLAL